MRAHLSTLLAGLTIASAIGVVSASLAAQTPAAAKPAAPRPVPRLPDGRPDLQGTYDLATLTPVERRPGTPLVLTDEEAKTLEGQVADRSAKADAPIDANRA